MPRKKNKLNKIWDFIWNSNSPWSWLINVIIAFIIIKFLVYPGLGLIFGTNLPIVAVVSGSMEHPEGNNWFVKDPAFCSNGPCVQMEWYLEHNITEKTFDNFKFKNGFNKGDLMLVVKSDKENTNVGDVIIFYRPNNVPVIHRIVEKYSLEGRDFYFTKGDNNPTPLSPDKYPVDFNEYKIPANSVAGKAIFRIPLLGWIKLEFTNLILSISGKQIQ